MTAIQPTSFVAFNPLLKNVEQIITASNESIAREGLKGSIGSTAASWKVLEVPQHMVDTFAIGCFLEMPHGVGKHALKTSKVLISPVKGMK